MIFAPKPKKISLKAANKLIHRRWPLGRFYAKDHWLYIGIDNHSGEAWAEAFLTKRECFKWLKGKRQ